MHTLSPLIYDLAAMLGIAGFVLVVFHAIRQPIVLGYIVAGVIIGPHTPPYAFVTAIDDIKVLSDLGMIFLMFSLGLEFSFKKLLNVGFQASIVGTVEVISMMALGFLMGRLIGWGNYDALFLGAALSISSTTIIVKAFADLGIKTKQFVHFVFGVLIIEDLLAILLLVGLSSFFSPQGSLLYDFLAAGFKLIIVIIVWFLSGRFLVNPFFRLIQNYINQETLTILSVASCLILVCVAAKLHYSTPLGAFIMGSILAETTLIEQIEKVIEPIRDIFAAVFFISVGMLIDPIIIMKHWKMVLLISIITIVGKIVITSLATLLSGQRQRAAICTGFSMAQIGEFSFIIVAFGLSLGVVGNELYPIIVAVSAITTFTTPYLIRLAVR